MKLRVLLTTVSEEVCYIQVPDLETARTIIEQLTRDDFQEYDTYSKVTISDEHFKDLTGEIQPHTPRLSP